jgi:NAD dependent epimerase/dehydratase family enzyme
MNWWIKGQVERMARFLITGGTGFIGSQLVRGIVAAGHEAVVITRNPVKHQGRYGDQVRYIDSFMEIDNSTYFAAVINLGGEGIGDKRWSENRKQVLHHSRIGLTKHLVQCLARLETRPEVMISGSAIGWYVASGPTVLLRSHEEAALPVERDWCHHRAEKGVRNEIA